MYLFPLGYGTIAADRRAEDNRLREVARERLRQEALLAQERANELMFKEAAKKKFREKELRRIDPGHDPENPLSKLTQSVLDELNCEKNSFGNYEDRGDSKRFSARDRQDVGRAMALAEGGFGLLDSISSNMIHNVFDRYSEEPTLPRFTVKGRSYGWKEIEKIFIGNYFLPGRQRLSDGATRAIRDDFYLEMESLALKLSVLKSGGLQWSLRGSSFLKPNHRKILGELNSVLEDYDRRLKWSAEYRAGSFIPGYSRKDVRELQSSIHHFNGYDEPPMDWLRPGVAISGEYTKLKTNTTRVYPIRCTQCQLVSRVEAFWPQSLTTVNWKKGKGIYRTSTIEGTICSKIESLHRATGCEGNYGIDSRSGNKVSN